MDPVDIRMAVDREGPCLPLVWLATAYRPPVRSDLDHRDHPGCNLVCVAAYVRVRSAVDQDLGAGGTGADVPVALHPLSGFFPRPFDITAFSDSVDYSFRDRKAAFTFAISNSDAAWTKVDGVPIAQLMVQLLLENAARKEEAEPS